MVEVKFYDTDKESDNPVCKVKRGSNTAKKGKEEIVR